MYGEVKNPFGLRNGIYITINDLNETERGLACNCVCPLCKGPFEARLGAIRVHHFAHSGEGCDETTAYLMGLYGLFKDYLSFEMCRIPRLTVYYQADERSYVPITQNNYKEQLSYSSRSGTTLNKIILSEEVSVSFESSEIVLGKSNRPEALIAIYHGRRLAFVISPPDTVCKGFKAHPYKNIATLEIVLSKKADLISRANTEMMKAIFSDVDNYRWLSSPLVVSAFERINNERKEKHNAYQKELEQLRIRQEEARQAKQMMRQKLLEEQQKATEEYKEKLLREKALREEDDRRMIEEQIKIPERTVVDSHNRRWIQCETCGKIATEIDFWTYQWNRGYCRDCERKSIPRINPLQEIKSQGGKKVKRTDVCPWCSRKLVRRKGRNGDFLGCSNYPGCRFTRSL